MTLEEFVAILSDEYATAEFEYNGKRCGIETATIVEVLEEGVAYLADIDLPGPDWDTEEIRQEDIEED